MRMLLRDLKPGTAYVLQLRSVDADGALSVWSKKFDLLTDTDTTPPPVPSKPILSARLGTITITWDGLGSAGEEMPYDFDHIEVHASTTSGFTPDGTTVVGSIIVPAAGAVVSDLIYNTVYYFKLVSVDVIGNHSAGSEEASETVVPLVNLDLINAVLDGTMFAGGAIATSDLADGSVDASKILAGAVTGTAIAYGAITADKISAGSIGATELAANSIIAGKIAANAVTAGTIAALSIKAGDIQANAITADKISAGAITAVKINAYAIDGMTINGVTITAGIFTSANSTSRIELGATGTSDPADELRMWNSYTVASIRNPSAYPGALRISLGGGGLIDFTEPATGQVSLRTGGGALKILASNNGLQARNFSDTAMIAMNASVYNVSASLKKLKKNITPIAVDASVEIGKNGVHSWEWIDSVRGEGTHYGLLADSMPTWMREGEGYTINGVVAFLWEALKQSNARIDALEKKGKPKV